MSDQDTRLEHRSLLSRLEFRILQLACERFVPDKMHRITWCVRLLTTGIRLLGTTLTLTVDAES